METNHNHKMRSRSLSEDHVVAHDALVKKKERRDTRVRVTLSLTLSARSAPARPHRPPAGRPPASPQGRGASGVKM